jgi:hypothetical protein
MYIWLLKDMLILTFCSSIILKVPDNVGHESDTLAFGDNLSARDRVDAHTHK